MFTDVSTEMTYPLIPLFLSARLGVGPEIIGVIEGIAESIASLLKSFSGHISDRVGKRKELAVFGYFLSTIGKFFLYLAASWPVVLLARAIDRFGKGIRTAPRDAIIAESVDRDVQGRAFGLHRTLDTFGAALGILISMFLVVNLPKDVSIYQKIFLISLIPAVLGVVVLMFAKETRHKEHKATISLSWKSLDPKLRKFLLVTLLFTLGNSSNQFILLRAHDLGISILGVLGLYLAYNLSYSLLSYPAGRLSDRIGRRHVIVPGYVFFGIVYFLLANSRTATHLLAIFIIYGFYMGLTEGTEKALISDLANPDIKATTLGLHATLVGFGLFPASAIAGLLWKFGGPQMMFYFGSATGIIAAILMWFVLFEAEQT